MYKYKKWLEISLFIITMIIIGISIFNYRVDSLGLFNNTGYLDDAAKTLTNRKMIAGLENYDERLFQELIIKNLKVKNDAIAVGSSRTMQLRKEYFFNSDVKYFNHSVSGASLEDYISITLAYDYIHAYLPHTIILGIDPWIFNKNNNQNRWKVLNKYYTHFLIQTGEKEESTIYFYFSKWKQLFNYETTLANIKMLIKVLKNNGRIFYEVKSIDFDDSIKALDGSIYYPYKYRFPDEKEVQFLAKKYVKGNVYSMENFDRLDNRDLFENFITYLDSKDVNVVFFLHPYNPISYDLLVSRIKYQNIIKVEKYLNKFAKERNIPLYGSYNPHNYRLTSKDFFDGMHGLESVSKNIFIWKKNER